MKTKSTRRALVTGANRGIGLEIVRRLADRGLEVLLAGRDEAEVVRAADALAKSGVDGVSPLLLDVTQEAHIAATRARLAEGGLDVLVNNAGVSLDGFDARVARETVAVNFFGALHLTDALLPLMRESGRVVMVSSGMGDRSILSRALAARFTDGMARAELIALMQGFVDAVARGTHAKEGWPSSAYSVSKIGMTALAGLYARELADAGDARRLLVNAVCPGWVRTRMGGRSAPRSLAEGADTPVWAALLPDGGPTGGFFRDRAPSSW